jgi:hypothetical protein
MSSLLATLAVVMAVAAPATTITAGPVGNSGLSSPSFSFTNASAASFECSLDGVPFTACQSPHMVGPLANRPHSFTVRAVGADGAVQGASATRKWTYVASPLGLAKVRLVHPHKATMRLADFTSIAGTVSSASRVTSVQVALQRAAADKNYFPPQCHFFDARSGRAIFQTCVLPPFTRVKGTMKWHYAVPDAVRQRLKPGRYTLIIRAFNAFNQGTRRDFMLTLR